MMEYQDTLAFARTLDQQDELRAMRDRFIIPVHNGHEHTYMLGNSLGLQPRSTRAYIEKYYPAGQIMAWKPFSWAMIHG